MPDFDVVVVGLGAWGSSSLCHLVRQGQRVLGLDRFDPPHERGSHHGRGRVIRMASPESPDYTPLMERSYALWSELEREWGAPLISEVGGLYVGPAGHDFVAGALASYRGTSIAHEVLQREESRSRYPWLVVDAGEVVVHEPGAGVIQPESAIRAHLNGALQAGATIRVNAPMVDWRADADGVTISLKEDEIRAKRCVFTVGSWSPDFLRLNLPLEVERQVVVTYDANHLGKLAIFTSPADEAECVYGLPESGGTYKVALHHGGKTGHPDLLDPTVDEQDLALVDKYVRHRLPELAPGRISAAVCRYTNTPDHHFVIGRHPVHSNVVMASGCSGRGYKLAAVIGEIVSRLCADPSYRGVELFNPLRF